MTLSCPVRVCTGHWPSGRSTWDWPISVIPEQPPSFCVRSRERPSNLRNRCSQVRRGEGAPELLLLSVTLINNLSFTPSVFTPPPKTGEDPFDFNSLPQNLGYVARMKEGLMYVYNDDAAADKHQPKDLPCSDYATFIDDMNFLIALIAQGPTWVFSSSPLTFSNMSQHGFTCVPNLSSV